MEEQLSEIDQSMWVFAARYAHQRNTGASLYVITSIKNNWNRFSIETKRKLIKEADEAQYSKEDWEKVKKLSINENKTDCPTCKW